MAGRTKAGTACPAAPPAGIPRAGNILRTVRLGQATRSGNGSNHPLGPTWEWGKAANPGDLKTNARNRRTPQPDLSERPGRVKRPRKTPTKRIPHGPRSRGQNGPCLASLRPIGENSRCVTSPGLPPVAERGRLRSCPRWHDSFSPMARRVTCMARFRLGAIHATRWFWPTGMCPAATRWFTGSNPLMASLERST